MVGDLQALAGSEAAVKLRLGPGFRACEVLGPGFGASEGPGEREVGGLSEDTTWTFLLAHDCNMKDEVG